MSNGTPEDDVDHYTVPDDRECPICGDTFDRVVEEYSECETSVEHDDRMRTCLMAGCASASPDPTLIIFEHEWEYVSFESFQG